MRYSLLAGGKRIRPVLAVAACMACGGRLETAGPVKPFFQNNVKHGHHYCLVAVNGRTLEFKAFGDLGQVFGARRTKRMIEDLHDHVIVCGFGRVGGAMA